MIQCIRHRASRPEISHVRGSNPAGTNINAVNSYRFTHGLLPPFRNYELSCSTKLSNKSTPLHSSPFIVPIYGMDNFNSHQIVLHFKTLNYHETNLKRRTFIGRNTPLASPRVQSMTPKRGSTLQFGVVKLCEVPYCCKVGNISHKSHYLTQFRVEVCPNRDIDSCHLL